MKMRVETGSGVVVDKVDEGGAGEVTAVLGWRGNEGEGGRRWCATGGNLPEMGSRANGEPCAI
jgi:hypothetical protein